MPKVRIASVPAKVLLCFLLLLIPAARAVAADVTLVWDPNPETDLLGYKVYCGTSSGVYGMGIEVGLQTTYTVTGLATGTYYFAVTAYNNLRLESEYSNEIYVSLTSDTKVTLAFPHPYAANDFGPALAADAFLGLAVANLDNSDATLSFTAFGADGRRVSGTSFINPGPPVLELMGRQISQIDYELFQGVSGGLGPVGWIEMQANISKVVGFFMIFDSRISILDGAVPISASMTSSILPEVEDQGFTRVQVINPFLSPATVLFELMKSDGSVLNSQNLGIQAMGSITADLFGGLFPQTTPTGSDYVRVTSDSGVLPLEILGKTSQYIHVLNAQDAAQGGTTLYCPQYAVGGGWRSTLSIVNLDSVPGQVTLRLIGDDGPIGNPQTIDIAKNGKAYVVDQAFFQPPQPFPARPIEGYVEIVSNGIRITGSVVFSDDQRSSFSSALPLYSTLESSMVFSHVASNPTYYTGISLLNPGSAPAAVTIEVYNAEGQRQDGITRSIEPGKRVTDLLTEIFPSMQGKDWTSGYVRVTADRGISAFALFGTHNLTALSAIPPQIAR